MKGNYDDNTGRVQVRQGLPKNRHRHNFKSGISVLRRPHPACPFALAHFSLYPTRTEDVIAFVQSLYATYRTYFKVTRCMYVHVRVVSMYEYVYLRSTYYVLLRKQTIRRPNGLRFVEQ